MKITIISGSNRNEAESYRISKWVENRLNLNHKGIEVDFVDLRKVRMSFNPDEYWAGKSKLAKAMAKEYKKIEQSDALIIVTPEWGGLAAPVLKHFILMSGKSTANKPIYTVGVSSTRTGAVRPIFDLHNAFKNAHGVFIPEYLVCQEVNKLFISDEPTEDDKYLAERADYGLNVLVEYAKALKQVRDSGVMDYKRFPNGM